MKRLAKLLTAIIVITIVAAPNHAFAADSKVSISGNQSAAVGSTITVSVVYSGNAIGFVNGQMRYDNSKLQYLSGGTSQGDAGLVQLKAYSTDAKGKIIFSVKFKAIGEGQQNLSVTTIETQNIDGDQSLGAPSAGMTFTVTGASATSAATTGTNQATIATASQNVSSQSTEAVTSGTDQLKGINPLIWVIAGLVLIGLIGLFVFYFKKKKKGRQRGAAPTAETLQKGDDEEEIDWSKILK